MKLSDAIYSNNYYQYTDKIEYQIYNYSTSSFRSITANGDDEFGFSNSTYNNFSTSSLTATGGIYYKSTPLISYCRSLFKDGEIRDFDSRLYSNTAYPFFGFTVPSSWFDDYVSGFGMGGSMVVKTVISGIGAVTTVLTKLASNIPDFLLTQDVDLYVGKPVGYPECVVYGYWFRNSATLFAIPTLTSDLLTENFNPTIPDLYYKITNKPTLEISKVYNYSNWIYKTKCLGTIKCNTKEFNYTLNNSFPYQDIEAYSQNTNFNRITDYDIKNVYISNILLYNQDKILVAILTPPNPIQKSFRVGYNFPFEIDFYSR